MNHSKDYEQTMKRNHVVHTEYTDTKLNYAELIFKHLRSLKHGYRLSNKPLIQSYTVAEHCYYTGLLFKWLSCKENVIITEEELLWVFQHDILESVTGDLLLPAKSFNSKTKSYWESIEKELTNETYIYLSYYSDKTGKQIFTPRAWELFKAVDLLELWLFCKEEQMLGNKHRVIRVIIQNCKNIIFPFEFHSINNILGGEIEELWT